MITQQPTEARRAGVPSMISSVNKIAPDEKKLVLIGTRRTLEQRESVAIFSCQKLSFMHATCKRSLDISAQKKTY